MLHKEENGIKDFEMHNETMIKNEANGINWQGIRVMQFLGLAKGDQIGQYRSAFFGMMVDNRPEKL